MVSCHSYDSDKLSKPFDCIQELDSLRYLACSFFVKCVSCCYKEIFFKNAHFWHISRICYQRVKLIHKAFKSQSRIKWNQREFLLYLRTQQRSHVPPFQINQDVFQSSIRSFLDSECDISASSLPRLSQRKWTPPSRPPSPYGSEHVTRNDQFWFKASRFEVNWMRKRAQIWFCAIHQTLNECFRAMHCWK